MVEQSIAKPTSKMSRAELKEELRELDWTDEEKERIGVLHRNIVRKMTGVFFIFAFLSGLFAGLAWAASSEYGAFRMIAVVAALLLVAAVRLRLVPYIEKSVLAWLIDFHDMISEKDEGDANRSDPVQRQ